MAVAQAGEVGAEAVEREEVVAKMVVWEEREEVRAEAVEMEMEDDAVGGEDRRAAKGVGRRGARQAVPAAPQAQAAKASSPVSSDCGSYRG